MIEQECQACDCPVSVRRLPIAPDDNGPFRYANVCVACDEAMDADMWVVESQWRAMNPRVPFAELSRG